MIRSFELDINSGILPTIGRDRTALLCRLSGLQLCSMGLAWGELAVWVSLDEGSNKCRVPRYSNQRDGIAPASRRRLDKEWSRVDSRRCVTTNSNTTSTPVEHHVGWWYLSQRYCICCASLLWCPSNFIVHISMMLLVDTVDNYKYSTVPVALTSLYRPPRYRFW